ncbi:MAG: hypothetical protein HY457_01065 [Parcubacteria group bacterium]|nr:hypothetical protein [Parcubacteria group bacterium]
MNVIFSKVFPRKRLRSSLPVEKRCGNSALFNYLPLLVTPLPKARVTFFLPIHTLSWIKVNSGKMPVKEALFTVLYGLIGFVVTGLCATWLFPDLPSMAITLIAALGAFIMMWFTKE